MATTYLPRHRDTQPDDLKDDKNSQITGESLFGKGNVGKIGDGIGHRKLLF
jgi:hypothetical protein